jgi:hypothetical protein
MLSERDDRLDDLGYTPAQCAAQAAVLLAGMNMDRRSAKYSGAVFLDPPRTGQDSRCGQTSC